MTGFKVPKKREQQGIVLLDALIAIVIFAIGILGIVHLQSNAVSYASDAEYRTEAAMLADQVIARMWVADPQTLTTAFNGSDGAGGAGYTAWNALVARLPSGSGAITVDANGVTEVTVSWTPPGVDTVHQYVSRTQVAH